MEKFCQRAAGWEANTLFKFAASDFVASSQFIREKHNLPHLPFYKATMLMTSAKFRQVCVY
jgi:hypothetical protein